MRYVWLDKRLFLGNTSATMMWGSTVSVGSHSEYSSFPEAIVKSNMMINIQYMYIPICYEVCLVCKEIASR